MKIALASAAPRRRTTAKMPSTKQHAAHRLKTHTSDLRRIVATDTHHDTDRPSRDLRRQARAVFARGMHGSQQAPPARRVLVTIREQEPDRAARLLGKFGHPGEFTPLVVEIAVHAERACGDGAKRRTDVEKLI